MISAREGQHTTMCNGKPYHNRCFRCHHGCKRSLVSLIYMYICTYILIFLYIYM